MAYKLKKLLFAALLSVVIASPKQATAAETIMWQAFQHTGLSFQQGVTMASQGMATYAAQVFRSNPELATALHQWSGPVAAFIQQQIQNNPAVRDMVARQTYAIANYVFSEAGKRVGATMAGEMVRPSNWSSARMGSSDPRVLAVVAVAVTSGMVGYGFGQGVLNRWNSEARIAEVNAESAILGLMFARLAAGTVKVCGNRSVESAVSEVMRRARRQTGQFYRGVLCRANSDAVHSCPSRFGNSFSKVANAGIPGYNREVLSNVSLGHCRNACLGRSWCLSFDYERAIGRCFLQDAHACRTGLKRTYSGHPYDHYSRNGLN